MTDENVTCNVLDETIVHVLPDEDEVLAYTHHMRKSAIRAVIVANNNAIPTDKDQLGALIKLADGMDKQALTRKRIKSDEKASQSIEQQTALIAEVLRSISHGKPSASGNMNPLDDIPKLPSDLPPIKMVDGEISDVGTVTETYDSFVARLG